jgi:hypothetical protein
VSSAGPRDATAFEVREALVETGCAVCRLSLRTVARLIRSIAYEQINDIELRQQLRRAGGFCNSHAHQWLAESRSVLGTALIYRDVLNASLGELDAPLPAAGRGRLRGLLGGKASVRCPLCSAQAEAENRYLEALLALVAADGSVLEAADALCRRHTLAALRLGGTAAELVAQRAREVVTQMLAELDEVIRKEDYRFRQEERTEAERSVPGRAIAWAASTEGLPLP